MTDFIICSTCGTGFIGSNNKKYCTTRCKSKAQVQMAKDNRRAKVASKPKKSNFYYCYE